jgi:hypothetical protein
LILQACICCFWLDRKKMLAHDELGGLAASMEVVSRHPAFSEPKTRSEGSTSVDGALTCRFPHRSSADSVDGAGAKLTFDKL